MLYSFCSILHSFFDAFLDGTEDCKFFVCRLAEHRAETTCDRCYRVVSGVLYETLYFLLQALEFENTINTDGIKGGGGDLAGKSFRITGGMI